MADNLGVVQEHANSLLERPCSNFVKIQLLYHLAQNPKAASIQLQLLEQVRRIFLQSNGLEVLVNGGGEAAELARCKSEPIEGSFSVFENAWVQLSGKSAGDEVQNSELTTRLLDVINTRYTYHREQLETEARKAKVVCIGNVHADVKLALFYLKAGEYANALRQLQRSKETAKNPTEQYAFQLLCLQTHLLSRNWALILSNASSVDMLSDLIEKEKDPQTSRTFQIYHAKISAIVAIAHIQRNRNLKTASRLFCGISSFDHFYTASEIVPDSTCLMGELLPPKQLALYMAVSLLSSVNSRQELNDLYGKSETIKILLEYNILLREVLQSFLEANYKVGLEKLESTVAVLRLDEYLGDHIDFAVHEIRRKAIVEFCSPFKRVGLAVLSEKIGIASHVYDSALPDSVEALYDSPIYKVRRQRPLTATKSTITEAFLLDYLIDLIASRRLLARIDYINRDLVFDKQAEDSEHKNLTHVARLVNAAVHENQLVLFSSTKNASSMCL